jgi:hypothetical protein
MTDLYATRPLAPVCRSLPRTRLPNIRIGAAFVSLLTIIADATAQAYLAPGRGNGGRVKAELGPEEQGRDPAW